MKKLLIVTGILLSLLFFVGTVKADKPADVGFDQYGYNYQAMIFVGPADGVDKVLNDAVWGDPTYANDWLVMKWSKGWNDARFDGGTWGPDAWIDNEWNGAVPGGSGEVWHYKIKWDQGCAEEGIPSIVGGNAYCVWDQFVTIMDQGTADGEHTWFAHGIPTGYGAP